MKTVKLHINSAGYLQGAHPLAETGPDKLMYEIRNVSAEITLPDVIRQIQGLILAHPHDGIENWIYEWSEVGNLPVGAVINRYPKARCA